MAIWLVSLWVWFHNGKHPNFGVLTKSGFWDANLKPSSWGGEFTKSHATGKDILAPSVDLLCGGRFLWAIAAKRLIFLVVSLVASWTPGDHYFYEICFWQQAQTISLSYDLHCHLLPPGCLSKGIFKDSFEVYCLGGIFPVQGQESCSLKRQLMSFAEKPLCLFIEMADRQKIKEDSLPVGKYRRIIFSFGPKYEKWGSQTRDVCYLRSMSYRV